MASDYIAENLQFLNQIFTYEGNSSLFENEKHQTIQKELSDRWVKENRLQLLNDLADRYTEDEVFAVVDKIIYANCRKGWEKVGSQTVNSLENFIKINWEPLKKMGIEYTYTINGNEAKFCVTKCSLYDQAKLEGAEKWYYHLLCLTDEPTAVGFNRSFKFSRTMTLMQGHQCCDHCYNVLSKD
jgi:hypothetical protein